MFKNKLVAIVNKQVEGGKAKNALAHMCLGFGAHKGAEAFHLMDYQTADGIIYPNISKMPFIILSEKNSNKMAQLLLNAKAAGLEFSAFTNTMTEGSWEDQEKRTKATSSEEIIFYALLLFGPWDTVTELTRKLSLWRD
jgi:hypothetical protein